MDSLIWIRRLAYGERVRESDVTSAADAIGAPSDRRASLALLRAELVAQIERTQGGGRHAAPAITCENDGAGHGFVIRSAGRNALALTVQLNNGGIVGCYAAPARLGTDALDQRFVITCVTRGRDDALDGHPARTLVALSALLLEPFRASSVHPSSEINTCQQ